MEGQPCQYDTDECIYLIHGFASAPKYPSDKASVLEQVFELPVRQLAYDSGASFGDNMEALKAQVSQRPLFFVGTSLGAFYASQLAEFFYAEYSSLPIMLNPCHNPGTVLMGSVGMHTNFATGEDFWLSENAVMSYLDIPFIDNAKIIPRWILLNLDDELIDACETQALYKDKLEVIAFKRGGHRFENIGTDEVIASLEGINNIYFIFGISND